MLLSLALCLGLVGCGSKEVKTETASSPRNLRTIAIAYKKATEKLGRPPEKVQELIPALKEFGEPSEILRSPEDGQEYVILWRTNADAYPALVLAYEKDGKGGRRYVQWGNKVWFQSDDELKKARFAPGHKAPF